MFLMPIIYFIWLINSTGISTNLDSYFSIQSEIPVFQKSMPKTWVILKGVSPQALWPVLISEDWAFYQHSGVDWNQLNIVIQEGIKDLKFKRGASTITQQVVKNLFLTKEKSFLRKFNEIILSYYLENKKNKKQILEMYLNLIELGPNLWGIKAASRFYFDKTPKELNYREGAFLAMLLPNPKKYSVSFRNHQLTKYASSTMGNILKKLVLAKIISDDEKELYSHSPFRWEKSPAVLTPSNEEEELVGDEVLEGEGEIIGEVDVDNLQDASLEEDIKIDNKVNGDAAVDPSPADSAEPTDAADPEAELAE
ncbi:MAG: transglycosylase domain-containing protein [Bacteriovoracaceae bacterium]|nr:transglycosylase domain-containing protein [Bacteriovoracaceae bacterium]